MSTNHAEIARALERDTRADYIQTYIKEPLEESTGELLQTRGIPAGVDDLILLNIFTYIDLFGYLSFGKNTSLNAVAFFRKYFTRVDKHYKSIAGLLYHCLRHGYVHIATPKRIRLRDGKLIDFLFSRHGRRAEHLKFKKMLDFLISGDRVDVYRLTIAIKIMYRDLLSAMDYYADDIRSNQETSDMFWHNFTTRRAPEHENEEEIIKRNRYITKSDFSSIRRRISRL